MNYVMRPVVKDDEPFLWKMLYYAAHMDEEGETSLLAAENNPDLMKYVKDWGRKTDRGFIALEPNSQQPIGAAWIRLLVGKDKTISYIDEYTPELAIAVLPKYAGKGVGTHLLSCVLKAALEVYPSVVLSVRSTNPAKHLYERMGFVVVSSATNRIGTASVNMLLQFK
ncbi:MAG: GNAT family N-acetyltransferase [Ktedonobacteraceae bacterium]